MTESDPLHELRQQYQNDLKLDSTSSLHLDRNDSVTATQIKHVFQITSPEEQPAATQYSKPHDSVPSATNKTKPDREKPKLLPVSVPSNKLSSANIISPIVPLKDYLKIQERKRDKLASVLKETSQSWQTVVEQQTVKSTIDFRERTKTDSFLLQKPLNAIPLPVEREWLERPDTQPVGISRADRLLESRKKSRLEELRQSYLSTTTPIPRSESASREAYLRRDSHIHSFPPRISRDEVSNQLLEFSRARQRTHTGVIMKQSNDTKSSRDDKVQKFIRAFSHPTGSNSVDASTQTVSCTGTNASSQTADPFYTGPREDISIQTEIESHDPNRDEMVSKSLTKDLKVEKRDIECQTVCENSQIEPIDCSLPTPSPSLMTTKETDVVVSTSIKDEKEQQPNIIVVKVKDTPKPHTAPPSMNSDNIYVHKEPVIRTFEPNRNDNNEKITKVPATTRTRNPSESSVGSNAPTVAGYVQTFNPRLSFSFDPNLLSHFKEISEAKEVWNKKQKQKLVKGIEHSQIDEEDTLDWNENGEDDERSLKSETLRPATAASSSSCESDASIDSDLAEKMDYQSIDDEERETSFQDQYEAEKTPLQNIDVTLSKQQQRRVMIQSPPRISAVSSFIEAVNPHQDQSSSQTSHPYLKQYLLRTGKDPVAAVLTAKTITETQKRTIGPGSFRSVAGLYKRKQPSNRSSTAVLSPLKPTAPRKKKPLKKETSNWNSDHSPDRISFMPIQTPSEDIAIGYSNDQEQWNQSSAADQAYQESYCRELHHPIIEDPSLTWHGYYLNASARNESEGYHPPMFENLQNDNYHYEPIPQPGYTANVLDYIPDWPQFLQN